MYSIDRAAFSIERNPSLYMDKEVQYMFISHYIDRYNYYWSTEDERLLMDGPSMSGEDGYLADWITSSDRLSYDSYMQQTDISTAMQHIGNIFNCARSFKGTVDDVKTAVNALKKADKTIICASGLVLHDTAASTIDVVSGDIFPLTKQVFAALSQDPTVKLNEMYDRFMKDKGFMSMYSKTDKNSIVSTALSIIGAFFIGGPVGAVSASTGAIATEALGFTVNTYTNLFNYAAWVTLRYGFSGRYAIRANYYLTEGGYY
jgi:hypothetical protein